MPRPSTLAAAVSSLAIALSPLAAVAGGDQIVPLDQRVSTQSPTSIPALGGLGAGGAIVGGALLITAIALIADDDDETTSTPTTPVAE